MSRQAVAQRHHRQAVDLDRLQRALAASWNRETSLDPDNWSLANVAWGQCAVTALIVQDYVGGELVRGQLSESSHYWNRVAKGDLDLTAMQFERPPEFSDISLRAREALLANEATRMRYDKLSQAVHRFLSQ